MFWHSTFLIDEFTISCGKKSYLPSPFYPLLSARISFTASLSLSIFDRSRVHFMSGWCQIFRLGDFSISRFFPVSPKLLLLQSHHNHHHHPTPRNRLFIVSLVMLQGRVAKPKPQIWPVRPK